MGFLDNLAKNAALWGAVQLSKDENGKPDPYKAAGIAAGTGHFSARDRARLGAMLGSQGAFDSDDSYSSYSGSSSYDDTDDESDYDDDTNEELKDLVVIDDDGLELEQ